MERIPNWLQQLSKHSSVRRFLSMACGVIKGVGLEVLYPNMPALAAFTLVIVGASALRLRKHHS